MTETDLRTRMEELGRRLGAREAQHADALADARRHAGALHEQLADALAVFERAVAKSGAEHIKVAISEPRTDDKHVRAVEFDLQRGRHRAIVTVKSRGEVTLVGPFKAGKAEGPCRSFPVSEQGDIDTALGDFLERFLEEAATP
jgi:hypothetical protein